MDAFQHELNGDIPIGERWVLRHHVERHVEVAGGSGQGKTTLTEWLTLGILERHPAGMLLIDPKGTSCQRWLGWLAENRITKPVWYVDLEEKVLRYNPLAVGERNPITISRHIEDLWEALCRIRTTGPTTQFRQMQRFVSATLRALIECDLTLADAYRWLTEEEFRARHLGRIQHYETRKEWEHAPSQSDLKSTMNFFEAFWRDDRIKAMYSVEGFRWPPVYDQQAIVLVNLRPFLSAAQLAKAVGTMLLTGLISHAAALRSGHKRWYVVVEDATDYVPEQVAQMLTMTRELDLYLVLIHHQEFDGRLQRAVDIGCRTKFVFGEYDKKWLAREYQMIHGTPMKPFQCAQIGDGQFKQLLNLEPTPESYGDTEAFKAEIFRHPWYGETKQAEPRPAPSHQKPQGPPPLTGRRGK